MSRFRIPLLVALIVFCIGLLGFAWWQHTELVRTQGALAMAQQRIGELQRKPTPAQAPVIASPVIKDTAPEGAVPAQAMEREVVERRGGPDGGGRGRAMMDLSSDPEIAPLLLNQRKRAVASRYGALLAKLGLPPAKAEQLTTLLAEKQLANSDARMMARSQGLDRDEAREMAKLADSESDAAIKEMLGDGAYAQLQNFEHTYAQRSTVNNLTQRLGYAGAALPAEKQEKLIQILAANTAKSAAVRRPGEPGSVTMGNGMALPLGRGVSAADTQTYLETKAASDAVVLQQASAILTPAQLATLQQMQQEENEQLQLNALTSRRMQQRRSERGTGNTPSS